MEQRTPLLLLTIAAVVLPLVAVRLHYTFGPATYDLMRDVRAFVDGAGIAVLPPQEPPGYALLLAQFFAAGIDPMLAGMLISLSAFVLSVFVVHKILGLTMESRWVLPATVVFLFQEKLLSHATQAWIEGAYAAATLSALLVFGIISRNRYRVPDRAHRIAYIALFSCIVAAPFWFRYTGWLVSVSVCAALLAGAWRTRDRVAIRECLLIAVGTGCLALAVALRSYVMTGTFSGTPVGFPPAYTFVEALRAMVMQTGLDGFGIPFRVSEKLAVAAPSLFLVVTAMAVFWLLLTVDRAPLPRLIAFNLFGYLFLFSYLESSTRLDIVSMRFVYPMIPLIALLLLWKAPMALRATSKSRRLIAVPALLLLLISTTGSVYKLARGAGVTHQQREFGYAPRTTEAALALMKSATPGTHLSIATNRFGEQLLAYTSRLDLKVIPYNDVFNGDYTKVFGIQPWSEDEARRYFREHNTEWIAFFYGTSRVDQYMEQNAYGDFVRQIHSGEVKGLEVARIELPDGLLVKVDPSGW